MITKSELQYLDIEFKYTFISPIGSMEGNRYIQDIAVEIIKTNECGSTPVLIGKGNVKILLLSQAMNDHYDIFEIFDTESYTMRIGNRIYDFDNYEIMEDLQRKLFGDDRFHYFSTACGLIVMQPFPLQLESSHALGRDNEFESKMGYDEMEHDSRKAMKSLKNYYKRIGYITVRGYKDLMFLIPNVKNDKLDAIDLEESLINPKA